MHFLIAPPKITNYLLTESADASLEAKGKSKFFHAIGYVLSGWHLLRDDLLQHPFTSTLEDEKFEPFHKLIYLCFMPPAPNGKTYCVRTVWTEQQNGFWLSTAFPGKS